VDIGALPAIDEHATVISADADAVWSALLDTVERLGSRPARAYARLVRARPAGDSGPRPLAESSTIPGFRVAVAVAGERLVLEGRHAFSEYALTFRIEPAGPTGSRLSAESRARFPGPHGGLYRLVVIGTRFHVLAVRRILGSVRRRAEQPRQP
jgi:hypothetical protein